MKEKILIAASILLVIGILIVVFFNIGLINENEGLTDEIKQLSKEHEELEDDLSASQDEASALETDIAALVDETTILSSDIEDTTTMIADLIATEESLELTVEKLRGLGDCGISSSVKISIISTGDDYREMTRIMMFLWYALNIGDIIDTDGGYLWEDDPDSPDFLLYQGSSEDWDAFLIFYGKTSGVFFVDEQCWINEF